MNSLVTAAFSAAPIGQSGSVPTEIVFFPEGEHEIFATSNGSPKKLMVRIQPERGPEIARKLQSALEMRQSGPRSHFGFDHRAGAASALPKSFRYEPGKGVVVQVEWTAAGRAAIEGKDFSYFSPTFFLDDEGVPAGLPDKGELGSLVNSPAFRSIERIAASDASSHFAPTSATGQLEEIARSLVAAGDVASFDEGIAAAVGSHPEIYIASLTEGDSSAKLSDEVNAALANLSAEDRAVIERRATELYLGGTGITEEDAYVQAMVQTPGLHRQCIEASSAIHLGQGNVLPAVTSPLGVVSLEEQRAGQPSRLVTSADAIRADTREKLDLLAELGGDGPWDKLFRISLENIEEYPDLDEKEAFRQASLNNPLLFQEWQDSLPQPSRVPLTDA